MQYKKAIKSINPVLPSNNKKFRILTYFYESDIANQSKGLDLYICFKTNNSLGKLIKNNNPFDVFEFFCFYLDI